MEKTILKSKRLILKTLDENSAAEVLTYYQRNKDEINQGYMTEAIKTAVDYAFKELNLHRIEANIMPKNKASLKVVEKLGFINEGISKKYLKINGSWEDHIHMVLLNEELE